MSLNSGLARVKLLRGSPKIVTYSEVLQFFNDKDYPLRISVQYSLIKVAIYEIYGMKWGARPLNLPWGGGARSPWCFLAMPVSSNTLLLLTPVAGIKVSEPTPLPCNSF